MAISDFGETLIIWEQDAKIVLWYNLDYRSLGLIILLKLTSFSSLIYFSMIFISEVKAILLVVIITLLLLEWIKSAEISDFISFKNLFIFAI